MVVAGQSFSSSSSKRRTPTTGQLSSHHTNDCAGSTRVWTPIIPAVVKTRIECFWGERHHVVAPVETPQPSVELVFAEAVVAHGRKTVVPARADASWHFQPSSEFFTIVIKTSQPRQADAPWRGGTDPPAKTSEPQFRRTGASHDPRFAQARHCRSGFRRHNGAPADRVGEPRVCRSAVNRLGAWCGLA